MKKIAKFEKVSLKQYKEDMLKQKWVNDCIVACVPLLGKDETDKIINEYIEKWYDDIKLPVRATTGSAGYDFFAPVGFVIPLGVDSIVVPTGIRCKMDEGFVLSIYPRSGLGFKYRVGLDNTVGIIDQDYYNSDNEGHIMIKLHSDRQDTSVNIGDAFAQGIFTEYCITIDDETDGVRNGGFGSTN